MTRHLITSALPYINGTKHLGNLAGSLLPADIHARYLRQTGREVLFACATDEHGTPAEIAATAAGLSPREFCDREHVRHRETYAAFGLSFDRFGRTSDEANHELTRRVFLALEAEGFIEEREIRQFWSVADARFLPDRYIIGTCPHCGHGARGDQCDGCSAPLDPTDLIDPRSAVSGSGDLELRPSRHLFLRQSRLAGELETWLRSRTGWPSFVTSIAKGWLAQGLEDRCITRDLSWGVPVPKPGWEGKVFYVWFCAPLGYIASVCANSPGTGESARWWHPDEDVRYVQFLGKDNVPFHAVTFPASILGSRLPIRTADVIKGFHWLTYEGGKFSTSQRRGVFLDEALEILPADAWRWWLTANSPEGSDADFSFERLAEGLNADLADNLGNLVNRVLGYVCARHDGRIPADPEPDAELEAALAGRIDAIAAAHEGLEFRRAANETRALWSFANAAVAASAPWTVAKSNPERSASAISQAARLVRACALASAPIVPTIAATVLKALGENGPNSWPSSRASLTALPQGTRVALPSRLFPKLAPDWADENARRFGGQSAG